MLNRDLETKPHSEQPPSLTTAPAAAALWGPLGLAVPGRASLRRRAAAVAPRRRRRVVANSSAAAARRSQ